MRQARWLAGLILVLVVGVAVDPTPITAARADAAGEPAKEFIEGLAERAISALADPDVGREERITRFRELLDSYFAVRTIGQWVLGRYWRRASPEERDAYLALFEDLIVATYADRFTRYSGETLKVTRTLVSEDSGDVLVFSEIMRPETNQPLSVLWRVRERNGDLKIVDVIVEGVSMGQTQRSEFGAVIRRNGGKVSALIEELRRRLEADS